MHGANARLLAIAALGDLIVLAAALLFGLALVDRLLGRVDLLLGKLGFMGIVFCVGPDPIGPESTLVVESLPQPVVIRFAEQSKIIIGVVSACTVAMPPALRHGRLGTEVGG